MGSRHWSSSELVHWLRKKVFKIEKPFALGWGEWADWDEQTAKEHPIGWFFTETLPQLLEKIPANTVDHIHNLRHNLSNRAYGTHCLPSTLPKGKWCEFETRMLFSLFDSFVDHLEIEVAGSHIAWGDKEDVKKYNVPIWHRYRWLDWGQKFRCPEAAISHLRWEMTLDEPSDDPNHHPSPHQAIAAREKMELYNWWKIIRPSRGSSWEATGFQKFWDDMEAKYGSELENEPSGKRKRRRRSWLGLGGKSSMTAAEQRKYKKLSEAASDLDEQWNLEDEQMMIRLVKIRSSLWT